MAVIDRIPELYHRDYYLTDCEGYREFRRTRGATLSKRLAKCFALAQVAAGSRGVDVGCGRGELAFHAARRGACAVALDPSPAALELVAESSPPLTNSSGCVFPVQARGEELPIPSGWAHWIMLSDVVEHLSRDAVASLFAECRRVLRRGGRLVVHTQPNRTLIATTVPVLSRVSALWGVRLPRDLRDEMSEGSRPPYHVHEQSLGELRRSLRRAHLRVREMWLEGSYPVHRIFGEGALKRFVLPRFRRYRWLKVLLASQIFAVAQKD